MAQSYKNIKNSASRDFKSYDTRSQLPLTGITEGTVAYVEDVRTLYVFDESAWYGIRLVNDPPVITSAPPSKVVVTRGNEYSFQLEGEDPDGIPLVWDYEVIEGNTSGLNISLLGASFSLTNNTSGKAVVIRFSANDGSNTVTSDTRFVLDDMEGLQGINLSRGSTINIPFEDADFVADPYGFQYDSSAPRTARIDISSGSNRQISYNESTNLIQTPADAYISPSRPTFLANGRIFSIQSNDGNHAREYIVTGNGPGYTTTNIDIASTSGLFMFPGINSWYVENNNTVYVAGYDNNNYTSLKLYKYFVSVTAESAWTELANKSYQVESGVDLHSPAYIKVKGDRVIMLMNSSGGSTKQGQIIIFDKSNLDVLGVYDASPLSWDRDITACENFIIQHGSGRMWDISDPANISEVTGLTWPVDAENFYLDSERLVVVDGYVAPANGDAKAYLYDFDSLRGTITNTGQEIDIPRPYFGVARVSGVMVEDRLYLGGRSADTVSSLYQAYMYSLSTIIPTPPTTTDIPNSLKAYLGEDNIFDIDGVEPNDRTIQYTGNVISGTVPVDDGVTVDLNTGEVVIRHDSESDYAYNYQFTLTDTQNEVTAYTSNIVVSTRQGPGATLQNSLNTEDGYFILNRAYLDGTSGYPSAALILGDRYFGAHNNQGWYWIDTLTGNQAPSSNTWATFSTTSATGVYYVSSSEVYRITNYVVYKSDMSNFGSTNTVVFDATSLPDNPVIENNNAGAVVRLDAYNPSHLWVLGTTGARLWKFDISNPNSWTALEIGTPDFGGNVQNNRYPWGTINDNYAFAHGEIIVDVETGWRRPNLLVRTLANTTVRYFDFISIFYSSSTAYAISGYGIKFAASRDYLFVTTGDISGNYKLTGTTDLADGRIFIFKINSGGSTPISLVNRYDIPGRAGSSMSVHDLSFVDGVLYAGVIADNEYIMSAQFDYNQETFTSVDLTRTERGFVPRIAVGTDAVYAHNTRFGDAWAGIHRGA